SKSVGAPTQSWEAIDLEALLIDEGTEANKSAWDLMLMEGGIADVAVPDAMHGASKSVGAPTKSWEAIDLEALLIDKGTEAQQNRPPFGVIYTEDDGKEEAILLVTQLPEVSTQFNSGAIWMRFKYSPMWPVFAQSTQVDCLNEDSLDLDQHLSSFKWLLIAVGGIFLRFIVGMMPSRKNAFCPNQASKRPGLSCFYATRLLFLLWLGNGALCDDPSPSLRSRKASSLGLDQNHLEEQRSENQRQSFQQLRQEMESRFNDLANRLSALQEMESGFTEMSGQLSALKEMESGFTEMSGQLSALTSIVSSDSRNSESRNLRSNARKLQSPLSTEDPVPYRRACTSHRLDKADIYSKIIDHLDDQDDIYYNRGTHMTLQFVGSLDRKYLVLDNGNAVCSPRMNSVYRVRAVNSSPEENIYSFYDPRRPGQYLYLPTNSDTVGMASLGTTDAELLSLTRERNGKYYWSAPREIEHVGVDPTGLSRCQSDCDEDR
ncbi:hypothetical protein THAOC_25530, partial [Thalassiosira oceanica]